MKIFMLQSNMSDKVILCPISRHAMLLTTEIHPGQQHHTITSQMKALDHLTFPNTCLNSKSHFPDQMTIL